MGFHSSWAYCGGLRIDEILFVGIYVGESKLVSGVVRNGFRPSTVGVLLIG